MMTDIIHYCYHCGGILSPEYENGFFRERCSQCGEMHYPQYKVGVAAIVITDGQILLAKRSYEPWKEYWNLPAGFVEVGETLEEAAARETLEETGMKVEVLGLHKVLTYHDDPRGDGIVLFYDCSALGGRFVANDEASECRSFAKGELPAAIAGAGHQAMLQCLIDEELLYD